VPNLDTHPQNLILGLISLASPNNVLDATYRSVFAALRTAIIKQPFTSPANLGMCVLSKPITGMIFVRVVLVGRTTVGLVRIMIFNKLTSSGSVQLTFK
jgi:hypothetical protein